MCFATNIKAQEIPASVRQQIEAFVEDLEVEDLDIYELYEKLANYLDKPFDINSGDYETLKELRLLSDIQINDLENHISSFGKLLDVYELQTIPSFDKASIERILLFVTTKSGTNYNVPLKEMMFGGKNELFLKWRRVSSRSARYVYH